VKILHWYRSMDLEMGGVVRAVLDISAALADRGHEQVIATFIPADLDALWASQGSHRRVLPLAESSKRRSPIDAASVARLQQELAGCDAVHLHGVWDPACMQLSKLARAAGVPYFISPHGVLDDWCMEQKAFKKKLYLAMGCRRMLNGAKAVHCTAEGERRQATQWFNPSVATVVPLVFDLDEYGQLPGEEEARSAFPEIFDGPPVLLFLSRIHVKKGLEHLVDAASVLRDRGCEIRVAIAGTGDNEYLDRLRSQAAELGLQDVVQFIGFVSGTRKVSLYQAADLFVLPTHQENWGFVLLEALACGTALLTTRSVDIWPELESSGGAIILERSGTAIADAVQPLLAAPERMASMGQAGRAWVLQEQDADRVAGLYEQLYS
jgi:glycosyltransferase involved in cell wall biosynthesis